MGAGQSELKQSLDRLPSLRSKPQLLKDELSQFVDVCPVDAPLPVKIDKKVFDILHELFTAEMNDKAPSPFDIMTILQALQRCMKIRMFYQQLAKADLQPYVQALRTEDFIALAAALNCVAWMLDCRVTPEQGKEKEFDAQKEESAVKYAFFEYKGYDALCTILVSYARTEHTNIVSKVLDMLSLDLADHLSTSRFHITQRIIKLLTPHMDLILELTIHDSKEMIQDGVLKQGYLLWYMMFSIDAVGINPDNAYHKYYDKNQTQLARQLLALMCSGHEANRNVLLSIIPVQLQGAIEDPIDQRIKISGVKRDQKEKVTNALWYQFQSGQVQRVNCDPLFNNLDEEIKLPHIVWVGRMKAELLDQLRQEIENFSIARSLSSAIQWDPDAFEITHPYLDKYCRVGNFFVSILIPALQNRSSGYVLKPELMQQLLSALFQRAVIEDDPAWKLACMGAISTMYERYPEQFKELLIIPYYVYLLHPVRVQTIWRDHIIRFMQTVLREPINAKRFLTFGGLYPLCHFINLIHTLENPVQQQAIPPEHEEGLHTQQLKQQQQQQQQPQQSRQQQQEYHTQNDTMPSINRTTSLAAPPPPLPSLTSALATGQSIAEEEDSEPEEEEADETEVGQHQQETNTDSDAEEHNHQHPHSATATPGSSTTKAASAADSDDDDSSDEEEARYREQQQKPKSPSPAPPKPPPPPQQQPRSKSPISPPYHPPAPPVPPPPASAPAPQQQQQRNGPAVPTPQGPTAPAGTQRQTSLAGQMRARIPSPQPAASSVNTPNIARKLSAGASGASSVSSPLPAVHPTPDAIGDPAVAGAVPSGTAMVTQAGGVRMKNAAESAWDWSDEKENLMSGLPPIFSVEEVAARCVRLLRIIAYGGARLRRQLTTPQLLNTISRLLLCPVHEIREDGLRLYLDLLSTSLHTIPWLYPTGLFAFIVYSFRFGFSPLLAKLIDRTHLRQAPEFIPAGQSALSSCLPPSLLKILKEEGAEALRSIMEQETVNPDIIWNTALKTHMNDTLTQQLTPFLTQLHDHPEADIPFPPQLLRTQVVYHQLEGELFLGGLYLRPLNELGEADIKKVSIKEPAVLMTELIKAINSKKYVGDELGTLLLSATICVSKYGPTLDQCRRFKAFPALLALIDTQDKSSVSIIGKQPTELVEPLASRSAQLLNALLILPGENNAQLCFEAKGVDHLSHALARLVVSDLHQPDLLLTAHHALASLTEIVKRCPAALKQTEHDNALITTVTQFCSARLAEQFPHPAMGALNCLAALARSDTILDMMIKRGALLYAVQVAYLYNPNDEEHAPDEEEQQLNRQVRSASLHLLQVMKERGNKKIQTILNGLVTPTAANLLATPAEFLAHADDHTDADFKTRLSTYINNQLHSIAAQDGEEWREYSDNTFTFKG